MTAADLIAANLGTLTYPGDTTTAPHHVSLPGYRTTGMPPDMAEQANASAHLIADAIIHLLTSNGYTISSTAEHTQLQTAAAAAEPQRNRTLTVTCTLCRAPLFTLAIADFNTSHPTVNGPNLIRALHQLDPDCATTHRTH